MNSPFRLRWLVVRLVDTPNAPARTAAAVIARMRAMSSAVAGSNAKARAPITYTRTAACGSSAHTSTSRAFRSSVSR